MGFVAQAVAELLAEGVDPNGADYDLRAPLHVACSDGHKEVRACFLVLPLTLMRSSVSSRSIVGFATAHTSADREAAS
jgi:ankyrin repeat protein